MAHAEQVLNCSFDRWHPAFQAVAFRAQLVPLSKEFVEYLVEDGVYLPENNSAVSWLLLMNINLILRVKV